MQKYFRKIILQKYFCIITFAKVFLQNPLQNIWRKYRALTRLAARHHQSVSVLEVSAYGTASVARLFPDTGRDEVPPSDSKPSVASPDFSCHLALDVRLSGKARGDERRRHEAARMAAGHIDDLGT